MTDWCLDWGTKRSENWFVKSSMKFSRISSKFLILTPAKSSSSHFDVSTTPLTAAVAALFVAVRRNKPGFEVLRAEIADGCE